MIPWIMKMWLIIVSLTFSYIFIASSEEEEDTGFTYPKQSLMSRREKEKQKEHNDKLELSYKYNRSYVTKGNQILVYKPGKQNKMNTVATIKDVLPGSSKIDKIMAHDQDSKLIVKNQNNQVGILDIETNRLIQNWSSSNLRDFTHTNKLAQITSEPTYLAIDNNSMYKVDTRIDAKNGNEIQEGKMSYKINPEFNTIKTSNEGWIVTSSNKGEIRLYDRLGIRAKSLLPNLGDKIISLDVTLNGQFILATTKSYILLIDTTLQGSKGPTAGDKWTGFLKSFPKDKKPAPIRLTLSPQNLAYLGSELDFKPARFDLINPMNSKAHTKSNPTSLDERYIVTSSGNLMIVWSLTKVLKAMKSPSGDKKAFDNLESTYVIGQFDQQVVDNQFQFNNNKDIVVTLRDEVAVVPKRTMKKLV